MSYTVAQNTSFLTTASILQRAISFVYFIIITRFINVGDNGWYFLAITFTTIFSVLADFGLGPILTRELSKKPDDTQRYVNSVFWTKVILSLITYLIVVIAINVMSYPVLVCRLVYLSGITMIFDNLQIVFYSIFRARRNLIYESVGIIGSQFLTLIIGGVALFSGWSLIWLILAYTIPSFLNFLYISYFARRVYNLHYNFVIDRPLIKLFLKLSFPFALAAIIGRLYTYTDTLMISKFLGADYVGYWSVPYKITFAFHFIATSLAASVYPAMSALAVNDLKQIGRLFEKSWRYLFTIALPIAAGIMALAEPLIIKLHTIRYAPSIPVLQILLISLTTAFLSYITGALLNAIDKQKIQTALMGAALVSDVALNIFLMPKYGIRGAAISALVSSLILTGGGYYYAKKYVNINGGVIFKYFNQAFWPAVLMGASVYLLSQKINFIFTIPIGVLLYGGLLFATGGIDVRMIKDIIAKIWKKVPPPETEME